MPIHQVGEFCKSVRSATGLDCTPAMLSQMETAGILEVPDRSTQSPGGNRLYSDEVHLARACLAVTLRAADLRYGFIKQVIGQINARPGNLAEEFWTGLPMNVRHDEVLQLLRMRLARLLADDLVAWSQSRNNGGSPNRSSPAVQSERATS